MSKIADAIVETSGVKVNEAKFKDRQDYLAALIQATKKISDKEFEGLTSKTQNWINDGVNALKDKEEIPELPDAEVEKPARGRGRAAKAEEEDEKPARGRGRPAKAKAEEEDEKPARGRGRPAKAKAEEEAEDEKPTRGRGRPAAKAKGKAKDEAEDEKPARGRGRPAAKAKGKSNGKDESQGVDRYGIRIGSSRHTAIQMLEEGAPMAAIRKETGTNHYNLLQKLEQEGHTVEHLEGVIKLTHKDDSGGSKRRGGRARA